MNTTKKVTMSWTQGSYKTWGEYLKGGGRDHMHSEIVGWSRFWLRAPIWAFISMFVSFNCSLTSRYSLLRHGWPIRQLTARQKAGTQPHLRCRIRAKQQSFWESQGSAAAWCCVTNRAVTSRVWAVSEMKQLARLTVKLFWWWHDGIVTKPTWCVSRRVTYLG